MAELIEDPKKKKASFGDAAAAATDGGVTQLNVGKPGDFPVNPDGTPMQKVAPSLGALGPSVPTTPVQAGAMSKYDQDLKNANDQAAARLARPVANPDASVAISSYLDLQQKANDLKPSYFSQSTPTSSAMLAQAQSDANNALGAVYTQGGPASKAPAPVTAGPQSPAMPGASLMENYTTRMNPDQYAARAAPSTPQIAASDSALPTTAPPIPAGAVKTQGQMNMEADLKSAEAMKAERLAAEGRAPQAVVTHSGNDWQARNNLRNLEVSASSMTAQPKDLMAYEIARKHDTQLQGGSTAADVANVAAVNRHNEINSTAQVANARTAQQGQQFGASQELAKQRLALDSRTQGAQAAEYGAQARLKTVQANAAEQLAALQNRYMSAKPEEQAAIAKQIQTLSGKSDKAQLHTVNQPDTMAPDGMTKLGGGQRLVVQGADGSFHEVPVGTNQQPASGVASPKSKAEYDALPKGAQYMKDGVLKTKA